MTYHRLFSPGKSFIVNSVSRMARFSRLPVVPFTSDSPLPIELSKSLLYPELATFHRIIYQIENPVDREFEVYNGPVQLQRKIIIRSLLAKTSDKQDPNGNVNVKDMQTYVNEGFFKDFNQILLNEKQLMSSSVTPFVQQLKERFDAVEEQLQKSSNSEKSRTMFFYLLFNIFLFGALFYITYFVYDWEVVEPISYLIVVCSNLIWLLMMIRKKKVNEGHQLGMVMQDQAKALLNQRVNFAFNKKSFYRFYYEYQELGRYVKA